MASDSNFSRLKLDLSLLIWVCFVLFALNALIFTYFATAAHIRSDVLRHLEEIVIPLLEGRAGFSILWSNHHPSPLLHLIQIANLKFFGFRLDYDAYLGVFFQILGTFLILKKILTTTGNNHPHTSSTGVLGAVLIISIALGFNCLLQYTWPLLATVQYLYFFAIVVFLLVDRCIAAESRSRLLAVAAASLGFMFANADYGTIFLAAIIAVLVIIYCIERQDVFLRTTLILAAAWIAYRLFMLLILPEGPPRPPTFIAQSVENILREPLFTFTQFAIALSTGLVDTISIKNNFPGTEYFLVGVAQLNALLFIVTFLTYLRRKLYRVSVMPLALMLAPVMFSASIFIYRSIMLGNTFWSVAEVERYAPTFKLAILGMLWALWLILKDLASTYAALQKWQCKTAAALCIGFILFIQGMQIHAGWLKMPAFQEYNDSRALAVFLAGKTLENDIFLPPGITNTFLGGRFSKAIAYLERNQLNVFSEDFPAGALLDQHMKSRRQFYASDNAITIVIESGKHGNVFKTVGNVDVDWKVLPTGIFIHNTSTETLYLRIKASAISYVQNGISLTTRSQSNRTQLIQIFKGHQNLFFHLEKDERFDINTVQPIRLEEMELRN